MKIPIVSPPRLPELAINTNEVINSPFLHDRAKAAIVFQGAMRVGVDIELKEHAALFEKVRALPQKPQSAVNDLAREIESLASCPQKNSLLQAIAYPLLFNLKKSVNDRSSFHKLKDSVFSSATSDLEESNLLRLTRRLMTSKKLSAEERGQVMTNLIFLQSSGSTIPAVKKAVDNLLHDFASHIQFDSSELLRASSALNPHATVTSKFSATIPDLIRSILIAQDVTEVDAQALVNVTKEWLDGGAAGIRTLKAGGQPRLTITKVVVPQTQRWNLEFTIADEDDRRRVKEKLDRQAVDLESQPLQIASGLATLKPDYRPEKCERKKVAMIGKLLDCEGGFSQLRAATLIALLENVRKPAVTDGSNADADAGRISPQIAFEKNAVHSEIVALIDRQTKGMRQSLLGGHSLDVVKKLTEVMGDMHAATFVASGKNVHRHALATSQNPQTHAYNVFKLRLKESESNPDDVAALLDAVWKGGTLDKVSTRSRTISRAQYIKGASSVAITAGLLALSKVAAPAIAEMCHAQIDLLNIDIDAARHLEQQYAALLDTLHSSGAAYSHLSKEVNDNLATVQPGSELCNQLYDIFHPKQSDDIIPWNSLENLSPDSGGPLPRAMAPPLLQIGDWHDAARQLDAIDLNSLSEPSKAYVISLKAKVHAGANLYDTYNDTVYKLNSQEGGFGSTWKITERILSDETDLATQENYLKANHVLEYAALAPEAEYADEKSRHNVNDRWKKLGSALKTVGPIGMTRIAAAGVNIYRNEPNAPIRQAIIRRGTDALKKTRQNAERSGDVAEAIPSLARSWGEMVAGLAEHDLTAKERAGVLHQCIKELDPQNFSPDHQDVIDVARHHAIARAPRTTLQALLPELMPHPASYMWLANYLITTAPSPQALDASNEEISPTPASANFTPAEIDAMTMNIKKMTSPLGSMSLWQLRSNTQKLKNAVLPAAFRPDFGLIGGREGRRRRIEAIELHRAESLNKLEKKQQTALAAAKDIQLSDAPEKLVSAAARLVNKWEPPNQ